MAPSWSELPSKGRLPSPVGVRDTPRTGQEEATGECPDAHLARLAEGAGRRGPVVRRPEGGRKHLREAALWEAARVEWEGARETVPEI